MKLFAFTTAVMANQLPEPEGGLFGVGDIGGTHDTEFNGVNYHVVRRMAKDWNQAKKHCEDLGMHLIEFQSKTFIFCLFRYIIYRIYEVYYTV